MTQCGQDGTSFIDQSEEKMERLPPQVVIPSEKTATINRLKLVKEWELGKRADPIVIKVFRQVTITKVETNLIKCCHGDTYSRYYYSIAYYIIVYPSLATGHIQTYNY